MPPGWKFGRVFKNQMKKKPAPQPAPIDLSKVGTAVERTYIQHLVKHGLDHDKASTLFASMVEDGEIECVGMAGVYPGLPVYKIML